jgi:hypothetical protein
MASSSLWQRFQRYLLYYRDVDLSLDISRMKLSENEEPSEDRFSVEEKR